ncbi:response regulator [Nocardioides euryhalodurans]|uniref:Response regulator transcription factor n=1 Tax=Nocardioides euryhalodurans TaxID=2518370 RepID=A0A4P7GNT7_9ACTN|nr:response regulator transcription factor [Nocardioides euryhalodurans]QBR93888.1 response regulator transcription factor [Nocardioides euryhalodurans]
MTSVVIADDQELIRVGLRTMLESRGIDVVAEAGTGGEALDATRRHAPDVVLMDIRMPGMDGIAATAELVREGLPSRVLVLTTYDLDELVYRALRTGAAGFLLKTTPAERIAAGVEVVASGDSLLSPGVTRRLIAQHAPGESCDGARLVGLTEREREVLVLVARGRSNTDIATDLVLTEATVKTHVNRLFAKLRVRSRAQAVVVAYESGLVVPGRRDP